MSRSTWVQTDEQVQKALDLLREAGFYVSLGEVHSSFRGASGDYFPVLGFRITGWPDFTKGQCGGRQK